MYLIQALLLCRSLFLIIRQALRRKIQTFSRDGGNAFLVAGESNEVGLLIFLADGNCEIVVSPLLAETFGRAAEERHHTLSALLQLMYLFPREVTERFQLCDSFLCSINGMARSCLFNSQLLYLFHNSKPRSCNRIITFYALSLFL